MKNHIKQTFANIDQGVREPRSIGPMMRASLIRLWSARGGGLYGLGYVLTFVALEVPTTIANVTELVTGSASVLAAILEWLLRFGLDTLLNMLWAFLWPVFLLENMGGWGVAVLVVGFIVFEKLLRPMVESAIPELKRVKKTKKKTKTESQEQEKKADSAAESAPL